jgi:hypothetical protein
MAISEESRHQLHNKLDEVLGPAEAATLMAHLPPIGWADVATKHDLAALERRIDMQFGEVDRRFSEIDRRFSEIDRRFEAVDRIDDKLEQVRRELRSNLMVSVATSAAMLGAVVAAIKL